MNTPLSWIKAYVPELDCTVQEYCDAMTLSGTKVEGATCFDADLDKIIVAKIVKIDKHPDADKLVVCQVQINEEGDTIQIVTGAKNVFEGAIVPAVLDGGKVAGGHDGSVTAGGIKIKKGKLRGVESNGMMCSIEELGQTRDNYPDAPEDGIFIFNDLPQYKGIKLGDDAIEVFGLHDANIEYEVTSNRVDCFGIIGIAREAAATFRKPFVPPVVKETGNNEKASDYISVEVKATDLCSRYIARVVKNIKIAPSPEWMQRRLAACGIRPINNIVDITNYVMEEYGQPMHAYDLDTIEGKKIVVDRAKDGDTFVTLDGQERKLDAGVLMINDGAKAVGIAGIMGGENSKITDDVKTMLFEAACFDGTNIRLSGRRIGLRSDAAGKFEKGLDPNTTMEAMNRACQLIEELGAGEVVGGCVDVYPNPKKPWVVPFSLEKCNKLLGTNVGMDEVREYFKRLELDLNEAGDAVTVPTWRQDVLRNADLAEEIARFFGYDKIPTTLPSGEATMGGYPFEKRVENVALDAAVAHSYCESMTYSFESPKVFDKLLYAKDAPERVAIKISNPLGEDFSVMRTVPVNGMLTSLATNYNRRNKDVKLFEMAKVYLSDSEKPVELPDERVKMVLGCIGEGDFFTMKGTLEEILIAEGMKGLVTYENKGNIPFLHPGRQAVVTYGNKEIGYLGEVHPDVADAYGIGEKAYLGVLDMKLICEFANFDYKYEGIAKFPAMSRDISMVMKKEITAGQIEEIIRKRGGKLLESYNLFDIYEGIQIRTGYKSMAYTVTFRDKEKTLEDKTVNEIMDKILKSLEEIGVELRK